MKTILITAGPVYGTLDDNKIVSNRSRGIWAENLAIELLNQNNKVHFVCADIYNLINLKKIAADKINNNELIIHMHKGYYEYLNICETLAKECNAAIMAAAVMNWIPKEPFVGKMPTKQFKENDEINIKFILAPRVISRLKKINPKLTIIGCKLLSNETKENLIDAAYQLLIDARCNMIIANDLNNLKQKALIYPDRSYFDINVVNLNKYIIDVINCEHFITKYKNINIYNIQEELAQARENYKNILNKFKDQFVVDKTTKKIFGSVAVRVKDNLWIASRRGKEKIGDENDAVLFSINEDNHEIYAYNQGNKPTLAAPILIEIANKNRLDFVVHFHSKIDTTIIDYNPPGSIKLFNDVKKLSEETKSIYVDNHGFFACLNNNLEIII